jgi:hypothetical protein
LRNLSPLLDRLTVDAVLRTFAVLHQDGVIAENAPRVSTLGPVS